MGAGTYVLAPQGAEQAEVAECGGNLKPFVQCSKQFVRCLGVFDCTFMITDGVPDHSEVVVQDREPSRILVFGQDVDGAQVVGFRFAKSTEPLLHVGELLECTDDVLRRRERFPDAEGFLEMSQ